jgi:hypothetical protein
MPRAVTAVDRIEAASLELGQINDLLEQLWQQRHALYRAFRAIRTAQRNLDAVRAELEENGARTP